MALPPHLADLEGRLASRVDEALSGFRLAVEAKLREATERLLADTHSIAPLNVAGLLAEVESEALEAAPRREGARAAVVSLLEATRSFDGAATQSEVLSALLAAASRTADRSAILLVRDGRLLAFESRGVASESAGDEWAFDGALRSALDVSRGCRALDARAAAEATDALGWPPAGAAVVVPLVLRDQVAALLWADRASGTPELETLQLLAHAAAQRLELQALSERASTPTLFEAGVNGEPLPYWSVPAPSPSALPILAEPATTGIDEPKLDATDSFEIVGDDGALVSAAESAAPEAEWGAEAVVDDRPLDSPDSTDSTDSATQAGEESVADELWTGSTTAAFETFDGTSEPVALRTFEMEAIQPGSELDRAPVFEPGPSEAPEMDAPIAFASETAIAAEWEPETQAPGSEPAAFPPPISELGGDLDLLQTRRLPLMSFPPAPERPPEETTAALTIAGGEPVTTHEFPAPMAPLSPVAPPPPAASEPDPTEDATLLTQRFPVFPAFAAPPLEAPAVAQPTIPVASMPVAPAEAPPAPAEDPMDRTASRMRSTEVAPPPDLQGPGRAFQGLRAQRAAVEPPTHEEAKRLARLLISEIKLYNEEQVLEGRRNRDLYHRLKEDIDRSRQIYEERVDPAVRSGSDYFHQELVRSLAGGDPRALGI